MKLTARGLRHNLLVRGPIDGPPVLLVHGNCSSGAFWEPLVRLLPAHWRIVAPDLRGYGETDTVPVDATRGLRDFADDLAALLDAEEVFPAGARPVVVGHSMGGGVAMQLLIDAPERVAGLVLEAPLSPYGFGLGGAGAANPEFVERLVSGDRTADSPPAPARSCGLTTSPTRRASARTRNCCSTPCCPPPSPRATTPVTRPPPRSGPASAPGSTACSTPWRRAGSASPTTWSRSPSSRR
nr:hypothetical protein GCM10020093_078690 [Planobispora longispora]